MEKATKCVHSWVFLESRQHHDCSGYGGYHRRDEFYCSKCLERKINYREHFNPAGQDIQPEWYTGTL